MGAGCITNVHFCLTSSCLPKHSGLFYWLLLHLSPDSKSSRGKNSTSVRSVVYDSDGEKHSSFTDKVVVLVPEPGASEIDPEQLWNAIRNVIKSAVDWAKEQKIKLEGIGMSLQRNTGTFWDRERFPGCSGSGRSLVSRKKRNKA